MSETAAVTPPDQTVWWDKPAVTAKALAQLRLSAGDVDAARVGECVDVAGYLRNVKMDRVGPPVTPVPPNWEQALVVDTVQIYLGKDSPPSDPDLGLSLGYVPADPLATGNPLMAGSRERWGVS